MHTFSSDHLSTRPPGTPSTVRTHAEGDEQERLDLSSSRSQVRATLQISLEESFRNPSGVRVSTVPAGMDEAAAVTAAAKDGEGRQISFQGTPDKIRKRSLRRALKCAINFGKATYMGHPLRVWSHPQQAPPSTPAASRTESRPGPERIQCIHWNSGGLSEELKAEWFTWLRQMPEVKLFTMVETHWGFSNSYVSEGWHITHSGKASGKGCGIMIGIRADCVDQLSIKWREIIPVRLLHWRGTIGRQQTDIVALYQTALGFVSGDKQDALMRERLKLWKSMDDLLSGLPFRSSIIVMGDFNATLSPLAEVAGSGILQGASVAWLAKERENLMEVLKKHRLVALNTWHKPQHTYHHPNGKSQIDYILVRKQLADNRSRKCSAISSPIAAWRSSGHHPLSASLKLNWKPWQGIAKQQHRSRETAPAIEEISKADCPSLQQLQHAVKQHLEVPHQPNPRHQQKSIDQEILAVWRKFKCVGKQSQQGMVIQ